MLVGSAHEVVDPLGLHRHERHRVGSIDQGLCTDPSGSGADGREIGRISRLRLDQAESNQARRRSDGVGQRRQRRGANANPVLFSSDQQRERHRGELAVGDQDLVARLQHGGHRAHADRHRRDQRDGLSRRADELAE
jgi:hypothetical protein